ncbi:MAG: TetR/AcrR family transcriptional regulator [Rhodocyclaceae bacterium]|nr:MAG: TetR/AcrR family transcriptional regulator [Rhodocyclaceae bacterium]
MAKRKASAESTSSLKSAAVKLFASRGYANTSLEDVANAAGFTKGAVYYHFKAKENLLLTILQDIEERSIGVTDREVRALQGTVAEKVELFSKLQARWAGDCPDDLAILMLTSIESARESTIVHKRVAAIYSRIEGLLRNIVEEGQRKGEIAAEASVEDAVLGFIATHDGNMLLWYRSGCDPVMGRKLSFASRQMSLEKIHGISTVAVAPALVSKKIPRSRKSTAA